jgi:hypothetical protein
MAGLSDRPPDMLTPKADFMPEAMPCDDRGQQRLQQRQIIKTTN